MSRWMNRQWMDGQMVYQWMNGWADGRSMDGPDGWMGRWVDGWMDGWADG